MMKTLNVLTKGFPPVLVLLSLTLCLAMTTNLSVAEEVDDCTQPFLTTGDTKSSTEGGADPECEDTIDDDGDGEVSNEEWDDFCSDNPSSEHCNYDDETDAGNNNDPNNDPNDETPLDPNDVPNDDAPDPEPGAGDPVTDGNEELTDEEKKALAKRLCEFRQQAAEESARIMNTGTFETGSYENAAPISWQFDPTAGEHGECVGFIKQVDILACGANLGRYAIQTVTCSGMVSAEHARAEAEAAKLIRNPATTQREWNYLWRRWKAARLGFWGCVGSAAYIAANNRGCVVETIPNGMRMSLDQMLTDPQVQQQLQEFDSLSDSQKKTSNITVAIPGGDYETVTQNLAMGSWANNPLGVGEWVYSARSSVCEVENFNNFSSVYLRAHDRLTASCNPLGFANQNNSTTTSDVESLFNRCDREMDVFLKLKRLATANACEHPKYITDNSDSTNFEVPHLLATINGQNANGKTFQETNLTINFSWSPAEHASGIKFYRLVLRNSEGAVLKPAISGDQTSYTMQATNLESGVTYTYLIRARSNSEEVTENTIGGRITVGASQTPGQVQGFTGTFNDRHLVGLKIYQTAPQLVFRWQHPDAPEINRYQIVVQPTDGSGWLYSPHVMFPDNRYALQTSGLVPGKSYSTHIRARSTAGEWGPWVRGAVFSVEAAKTPDTVPGFTATINGQNASGLVVDATNPTLHFSWQHASDRGDIERYHIVVQPADNSGWLYGPNLMYPSTSHSLSTTNLKPGMSYKTHIRAKSVSGEWGPFSNGPVFRIANTTAPDLVGPPPAVPNFVVRIGGQVANGLAINSTSPTVAFSWGHPNYDGAIERYHIVVQPADGSGWLTFAGSNVHYPATSASVSLSGLVRGMTYKTHIRAKSTDGKWGPYVNGGTFTVN